MSKSGPSLGEAVAEYWPVAASFVLSVTALAVNRTRPVLAAASAAGAAVLLIWLLKMMRVL